MISIVVYNYFRPSNNRNPVRAYTSTSTWKSKTPKYDFVQGYETIIIIIIIIFLHGRQVLIPSLH